MRFFSYLLAAFLLVNPIIWETDFDKAIDKAKHEHKLVLINFSGSDWCIPCIKMNKEIFESRTFTNFADSNLVLVDADFPRLKKHQLSKEQQKQYDKLADKYNQEGAFPYTLLLDENKKIIGDWKGYPNLNALEFVNAIKKYQDARK